MNLNHIRDLYLRNFWPNLQQLLYWYKKQNSLREAIIHASLGHTEKMNRHSHQRRISNFAIDTARIKLHNIERKIQRTTFFHDLYLLIDETIKPIKGIGNLYIYDSALRIGSFLDIEPEKVYLHAGTRKGAIALGINKKLNEINLHMLPKELWLLRPLQGEDLLCIFKNKITNSEILLEDISACNKRT